MGIYYSDRGIPLVCHSNEVSNPTITIENWTKWYYLYLINENKEVSKIKIFETPSFQGVSWYDHVPNPSFVLALAKDHNYYVDEVSLELIIGRFVYEIREEVF